MTVQRDALLNAVLAQPAARRLSYLHEACGENTALRMEIERLLREVDDGDPFLRSGGAIGGPLGEDLQAVAHADTNLPEGASIGPYRIVREIGRGGMGRVYLAERADDAYRKSVAIKLSARGGWSARGQHRFREERQILAGLEHVNVARLLDGGTTPAGAPFLVMEYVDGVRIDVYCDHHRLSITNRLKLFRDVCAAVQYAHQRLVVHRDIKPSNVLVTADGTPKLLDFGIAKLLAVDTEDPPTLTATIDRVFTPEYASPEQILGGPVTTATDVYQLGVLLYSLLTGRRPYRVAGALPHQVIAAICEQDPQRPSTAVERTGPATSGETDLQAPSAETVSEVREGTPDRLRQRLRGDLDAIVLTALRKAPDQRYGSAEQLAEDIRRHLVGLPVAARADSAAYRARRFLWRHRVGVAAVAAVFAALVGGLGVATWQARVARQERARAELQETRSRRLLYAAHMNLAGQYWTSAHVSRTVELLDAHAPAPGEEDLRGFEWYYLWRATHRELRAFRGTMPPLAVTPDGRLLAAPDDSQKPALHLWDVETGRKLGPLSGHADAVNTIDVSPDGTMLVSASDDKTSRLWRVGTREQVAVLSGHAARVTSATFDPTGSRIATSSDDATVKLWDLDGRELATLKSHGALLNAVAFSRDGLLLAAGSSDAAVTVWDVNTLKQTVVLSDRRPGFITSLTFSRDGHYLAATGAGWGGIAIWDLRTRQLLPINGTTSMFCGAFSPDGELFAAGGHDRLLHVWNLRTQRLVNIIRGHGDAVDVVRFLPDGKRIVTASREGTLRMWDVNVTQGSAVLRPGAAHTIAFTPGGERLAIGTDNSVSIRDVADGREVTSFPMPSLVIAVALSPGGQTMAALDANATVHVRGLRDETKALTFPGRKPLEDYIRSAAISFSADGRLLAAADGDNTVRVWNVGTWDERMVLSGYTGPVNAVAFSPDSRLLASAGFDATTRIHDLTKPGTPILLNGHTRPLLWVGFTSEGSKVITTSLDGTVRFWNPFTGAEVGRVSRGGDLGPAALTPDNRRLIVSGLGDPSLAIFDTATHELLLTLRGHTAPVSGVVVSPDGTMVASSSNDRTVRLWQAATAKDIDAWKVAR